MLWCSLEDTDFSRISSCLLVHYIVDTFVRVDSKQVSFNTSNDTKSNLLCPGKRVAVFAFAHAVGKFFNGVLLFSTVNNSCHDSFTSLVWVKLCWVKLCRVIQGLSLVV